MATPAQGKEQKKKRKRRLARADKALLMITQARSSATATRPPPGSNSNAAASLVDGDAPAEGSKEEKLLRVAALMAEGRRWLGKAAALG